MKTSFSVFLELHLPNVIKKPIHNYMDKRNLKQWHVKGCPVPPPHIVKQCIIADYQAKSGYSTLVETGTYLGAMIDAQLKRFKKIVSIEVDGKLFQRAVRKFRKYPQIKIYNGDSGIVLNEIMKDIQEPVIFWLDGHYSAGVTSKGDKNCPIIEEINAIFTHSNFNHVLLIDDAREFIGKNDYPTLKELDNHIKKYDSKYELTVKHDVICVERPL